MAEIISIINNKGGVGKTTTAENIAVGLAQQPYNKKVLLLDIEAQHNASLDFGWKTQNETDGAPTIFDAINEGTAPMAYQTWYENVWLVPASTKLDNIEFTIFERYIELNSEERWHQANMELSKCLDCGIALADGNHVGTDFFDYIIIDCPPSMRLLSRCALAASNSIIVPIQLEPFAVEGINGILNVWKEIKTNYNHSLEVKGIVRCMEQKQLTLSKGLNKALEENIGQFLCKTSIPRSTSVSKEQAGRNVIIDSDPYSYPALAYKNLLKELFT